MYGQNLTPGNSGEGEFLTRLWKNRVRSNPRSLQKPMESDKICDPIKTLILFRLCVPTRFLHTTTARQTCAWVMPGLRATLPLSDWGTRMRMTLCRPALFFKAAG
jgi:hypothetical protein